MVGEDDCIESAPVRDPVTGEKRRGRVINRKNLSSFELEEFMDVWENTSEND